MKQLKDLLNRYMERLKQTAARGMDSIPSSARFHEEIAHSPLMLLLRKGGLKLKLIGFAVTVILITVIVISTLIIQLMKDSIETKAFEVATTSVERIADFASHPLLERSYENKLNLSEMLADMKESQTEGVLDIAIYERIKEEDGSSFHYLAGFGHQNEGDALQDAEVHKVLTRPLDESISYHEVTLTHGDEEISAYRFVRPILYTFQDKTILLGVALLDYDQEAIYGVISRVIRLSLMITAGIVLLTIFLVYLAGLRFTRPIITIAEAATDVSKGNLDIDLNVTTNDEIEELAERFNHMVNGLREREKMQMFVSGSTMHMIQEDSKRQMVLGGEYRDMTFLFSDIRGFTAMSETKKPDEVVGIINFYLNLQSEIIKRHGGDIDKFVGDEIMASFVGEDAIDRAIQSGKEIQERIAEENAKRKAAGETVCNVGVGINHGEVIVGNIGSDERMDFTSIGAEVNLAARLCSGAKAGQILIEQATAEKAAHAYDTVQEEPIHAKGISHPVAVSSIMPRKVVT